MKIRKIYSSLETIKCSSCKKAIARMKEEEGGCELHREDQTHPYTGRSKSDLEDDLKYENNKLDEDIFYICDTCGKVSCKDCVSRWYIFEGWWVDDPFFEVADCRYYCQKCKKKYYEEQNAEMY